MRWSTVSTVDETGVTSTRAGSCRWSPKGRRYPWAWSLKEKRLRLCRKHGQQPPDVGDESHVEHSVGFVQYEMRQAFESHFVLSDQVEQPARGRDQNIHALAQLFCLGMLFHPAEYRRMPQSRVFAVVGKTVVDLQGEFPRGRQNQCPDGAVLFFSVRPASPVAAGPARFIGGSRFSSNVLFVFFQQVLQDRDGECRRFTRSCLRDAENVFSRRTTGIACSWMGVGSLYPFSQTALNMGSAMFSSLNVIIMFPHVRMFLMI